MKRGRQALDRNIHRAHARPRKPVGVAIVSNYLVARDK